MNVPNRKEKKIKKDLWSSFANIGSHELNKILTKIILKYKLTDYFIGLFFFQSNCYMRVEPPAIAFSSLLSKSTGFLTVLFQSMKYLQPQTGLGVVLVSIAQPKS